MEQHSPSQSSQRYNFTSHNTTYNEHSYQLPSDNGPYSDASQPTTNLDDLALLVDHLTNNYGLEVDYCNELHTFLEASLCVLSFNCFSTPSSSMDHLMNTPTNFTYSDVQLPPLNMAYWGSGVDGAGWGGGLDGAARF
ncbi:hypothetical protein B0H10DRAFT_1954227 [Mycena sp. CBHHK59/15]|nr:hypothetical protein B0H10DRAFT_1954227 [Mycena sp. CBHHK59/15]